MNVYMYCKYRYCCSEVYSCQMHVFNNITMCTLQQVGKDEGTLVSHCLSMRSLDLLHRVMHPKG